MKKKNTEAKDCKQVHRYVLGFMYQRIRYVSEVVSPITLELNLQFLL